MLEHFDLLAILKIIGIDIILGIDNAIVIAIACAALSSSVRNKAIFYGTAGAVIARIVFLIFGLWLFSTVAGEYIKVVAGAYLVYLAYTLLASNEGDPEVDEGQSFWAAVRIIVMADIMMSIDNVVAVTSVAEGTGEHSMLYAVLGVLLSIPIIIFASKGLLKLIDKFPIIMWVGSALIAWVGIEMVMKTKFIPAEVFSMHIVVQLVVVAVVLLAAIAKTKIYKEA